MKLNIQHDTNEPSAPLKPRMNTKADNEPVADSISGQQTLLDHGQNVLGQMQSLLRQPLAIRTWRPAGTLVAVLLALLLTWHVINGKDGLSVWQQKRTEDKELQKEINSLESGNEHLRDRISELKSDPEAIEREARETLHYAKPGEVIYALPAQPQPVQAAGVVK